MEFHENRAKAPFIGLVQLWQAVRRWRRQMQTRRVLQQMSDERLKVTIIAGYGDDSDLPAQTLPPPFAWTAH